MSDPIKQPDSTTPAGWYMNPEGASAWWDGTQWGTPPEKKKSAVTVPRWLAIAVPVAGLVLGIIIGGAGGSGTAADLKTTEADLATTQSQLKTTQQQLADEKKITSDAMADLKAREDAVAAREAAVSTVENTIAANTIPGSGIYLVNTDIAPGVYRSDNNSGCYWERDAGLSGTLSDIIANDNVDGQAVVEIAASDVAFQSSRCSDWVKIG